MNKVQLTQEGYDKLRHEHDELVGAKRAHAVERLARARAMGDLKENSEYHAAREELAFVEERIQEVEALLKNAQVIADAQVDNTVALGKKVTVEVEGEKKHFTIVGEYEADLEQNKLSGNSPIGHALLGKKIGEHVEIAIPAGSVNYHILDIK